MAASILLDLEGFWVQNAPRHVPPLLPAFVLPRSLGAEQIAFLYPVPVGTVRHGATPRSEPLYLPDQIRYLLPIGWTVALSVRSGRLRQSQVHLHIALMPVALAVPRMWRPVDHWNSCRLQ